MNKLIKSAIVALASIGLLAVLSLSGASWYYSSEHGRGCASCHEMIPYATGFHGSAHRGLTCLDCHEASLSTKLRHIRVHLTHSWPEAIRLREVDVFTMTDSCQRCHRQEYAAWNAGPHGATYARIFTDASHNSRRMPMDDCLRCHGMYFGGPIRDLVQPVSTKGPWHIVPAGLADHPAMPCQTCHAIHTVGEPATRPAARISMAGPAVPATLAFFDRRERLHFSAALLPIPTLFDGAHELRMSHDPNQALCYQCHAPRFPEAGSEAALHGWGPQASSGDDRTPMGVHEGLSCAACHTGHMENARASCKNCHPKMSNCGIDVETMDTTFSNAASKHNIHWVKCADCHQNGIPKPKQPKG
jgi:hypothetical protein